MHYVYIIQSINYPQKRYVGCSNNIKKRLTNHNSGTTSHTRKYKPWELIVCICFKNKDKAVEFEKYLKSGSGRAFSAKRFF
ncbi:MAG: GIY-YIG nuclease family protein [bacterium]